MQAHNYLTIHCLDELETKEMLIGRQHVRLWSFSAKLMPSIMKADRSVEIIQNWEISFTRKNLCYDFQWCWNFSLKPRYFLKQSILKFWKRLWIQIIKIQTVFDACVLSGSLRCLTLYFLNILIFHNCHFVTFISVNPAFPTLHGNVGRSFHSLVLQTKKSFRISGQRKQDAGKEAESTRNKASDLLRNRPSGIFIWKRSR